MGEVKKNKLAYSSYQLNFFQAVSDLFEENNTYKYILLNAVAGSGKTFSLIESIKFLPSNISIKFFAFNKSIAEELKGKLPPTVDSSTVHSFGMGAITRHLRKAEIKVNKLKSWKYIEQHMNDIGTQWESQPKKYTYIFDMIKLIDMYRLNLCELEDRPMDELVKDLMLKYDTEFDITYVQNFRPIWDKIKKYNDSIVITGRSKVELDFTDMVYLPTVYFQIQLKHFDLIFVDECQDLSKCQQAFAEKALKKDGKAVWVGDKFQAIYGFAGSDVESYKLLQSKPNTLELPLSVCYRCDKSIVSKAREIYDHIEPFENNAEGIVRDGSVFDAQEGDFVLCRNVRPLVKLWFEFIAQGKKCYVKGKELGKNLVSLVTEVKEFPKNIALERLVLKLEVLEAQLIEAGIDKPKKNKKYVKLLEDVLCIIEISSNYDTMSEVSDILDKIFDDKDQHGIQLLTIHKSKGLENERVFLCRLDLIPSKFAVTQSQLDQERNLMYVGITRAKRELVIDRVWKDQ